MDNFIRDEIDAEMIEDDDSSIYLSIGDLMSGLLMFFALLFITALLQLAQKDVPKRLIIGNVVGEMKSNNINVKVNPETGDISIQESILFAQGSNELKPEGKAFLSRFIPVYSRVIFSKEEFENEISRVVIECHTSSEGDEKINLELKDNAHKPYWVNADREMIRQVIVNLVSNSIKYGRENGKTLIGFYDLDKNILVEVSDTGKGISQDHLPRLFERFYRVDKGRSRDEGGTGLGLSIVKHIIEAHNQTINVRSRVDVGSTFGFTLEKAKKQEKTN